jgi:Type II secretion system (T2SS), protein E, N-terminal domain
MTSEYRPIVMRANRLLGASLVDHNLVKLEDLEQANGRLLEVIASEQTRQMTVLGILAYEMKVVKEDDVLQFLVDSEGIGLVDLRNYDVHEELRKSIDVGACWATWSVPFDREEDFTFVATAYYLSPAVRAYWEKQYGTTIVWYGTTLEIIADFLEKLETERGPTNVAAAT